MRCQATKLNPWSTRERSLKCDDECLRLQRNRQLAEALNIDPETHTDSHIPYSGTTLKLFQEDVVWAQIQEREFRVFAAAPQEKRLRFSPMPSNKRAFLHALAEDFGFDSESEDPEPHRHVCVFKTPRFVSAPHKTLAQCLRILRTASLAKQSPMVDRPQQQQVPYNAFLLTDPRFGLTIDELDAALAGDLAAASRTGPALKFTTNFLSSDEVVITATTVTTSAAVASSLVAATPHHVEAALLAIKPAILKTAKRVGLAGGVSLCHVDSSLTVIRREGDAAGAGKWNAVVSRGSWRRPAQPKVPAASTPHTFVTLKKVNLKKKEKDNDVMSPVADDWLAAAEKLEEDGEDGTEGREDRKENDDAKQPIDINV